MQGIKISWYAPWYKAKRDYITLEIGENRRHTIDVKYNISSTELNAAELKFLS